VAIEQPVGDDGFDLALFFGLTALGDAIQGSAFGINVGREREHTAVRRPDEFADAFGNARNFVGIRSVRPGHEDLRRAFSRREERDPFAIRRPSRRKVVLIRSDQLLRRAARSLNDPDAALAAIEILIDVRGDVCDARAVGRNLGVTDALDRRQVVEGHRSFCLSRRR
jgi:hypothetical protein